jgi:hypothetical protein
MSWNYNLWTPNWSPNLSLIHELLRNGTGNFLGVNREFSAARHRIEIVTEQVRPAEASAAEALLRLIRDEEIDLIVAAAIIALAFTIGPWVPDFALAGQPRLLECGSDGRNLRRTAANQGRRIGALRDRSRRHTPARDPGPVLDRPHRGSTQLVPGCRSVSCCGFGRTATCWTKRFVVLARSPPVAGAHLREQDENIEEPAAKRGDRGGHVSPRGGP